MYQCPKCLGWYDSYHYCPGGMLYPNTWTHPIPAKPEPKYCDQCGKKLEHECEK